MNPQNELFDAIENYLNEGMTEHERFAFEERIAQDKDLAAKVAEVRASNEAIYYASLAELKNTIGKDLKKIKYKESANWKKVGTISIISVVVVASLTTYVVSTHTSDTEKSKTETTKNNKHAEHFSEEKNTSVLSKEHTAEGIRANDSKIKNQPDGSLQLENSNKQDSIKADTVVKKSTIEYKSSLSENKIQSNQPESTTKKTETTLLSETKIACDKSFKINTEASCKEKETGSIAITSDGAYSYTYQVDIQSKAGSKALFQNLSAGVYDLLVTYGKECAYNKKITLAEKWCAMNEAYSFNPDYNEKWKPIYEAGTSGTILIYDKQGKEIYSLPFGSGNEEWIGNDKQGMVAPVGIYVALITYTDGRKEKVELTIVR